MSKDSPSKYYQNNKERLLKRARDRYESYLKKKKKKVTIWS